jgi:hypothetical protein
LSQKFLIMPFSVRRRVSCRETPHLSGHHRKALTMLACFSSLNRRIDYQNIGLERDVVDDLDNLGNTCGRFVNSNL